MRDEKHRYFYTTPQELIKALRSLVRKDKDVRLVKNKVGNLSIVKPVDDDRIYEYIGYVDVHEGTVNWIGEVGGTAGEGSSPAPSAKGSESAEQSKPS